MSTALAKIPPDLDPEFAQAYHDAEVVQKVSDKASATGNIPEPKDPLLELKAIAERQKREGLDRKLFADGSFDQVENDVTNVCKIGWDFLTRP